LAQATLAQGVLIEAVFPGSLCGISASIVCRHVATTR